VTVNNQLDYLGPLTATFQVGAKDVEPIIQLVKINFDPRIGIDLSSCRVGVATPNVPVNYEFILTNTSNVSIPIDLFPYDVLGNCDIDITSLQSISDTLEESGECGNLAVSSQSTDDLPPLKPIPVTLTFVPYSLFDLPCNCYPALFAEAPNKDRESSKCATLVIPKEFALDLDVPERIQAGQGITGLLGYWYAGGIDTENLRITITVEDPAAFTYWDLAACRRDDFSPNSICGKIAAI